MVQKQIFALGELAQTIEYVTPIVNRELEKGNIEGVLIIRNCIHRERIKLDPKRCLTGHQIEIRQTITYINCTKEVPTLQDAQ